MQGPPGDGHQPLQGAIGETKQPGVVGIQPFTAQPQGRLGLGNPLLAAHHRHPPLGPIKGRQQRRLAGRQAPLPQGRGQAQHRPPVAHHLGELLLHRPPQGKHRTALLPHRRQLGRIAHKHQAGGVGMGALQDYFQQLAIHHRGLIKQHQAQVFQGGGGLFGGFAALLLLLAAELEPQQPMDGGGIPGGA